MGLLLTHAKTPGGITYTKYHGGPNGTCNKATTSHHGIPVPTNTAKTRNDNGIGN